MFTKMDTHKSINKMKLRAMRRRIVTDRSLGDDPLKILRIQGKELCHLEDEIFSLHELEALDLRPERVACLNYFISELPGQIGRLINLRVLFLDTNQIYRIPPEIGKLQFLEKLSLSNNFLTNLPPEFALLQNLTSLHLSNNKFNKFPVEIHRLVPLEFLDMTDNVLSTLPNEINQLSHLHTLMLFHNCLETLPDTIGGMIQLRCLWLGNNKLRNLPRTFGNLKYLDWNDPTRHMSSAVIDGNPLEEPPIEICKQGTDAIAEYFGNDSESDDDEQKSEEERYVLVDEDNVPKINISDVDARQSSRENTPKQYGVLIKTEKEDDTHRTPSVSFQEGTAREPRTRSKSPRPPTPHYDITTSRISSVQRDDKNEETNGLREDPQDRSSRSPDSYREDYRDTQRSPDVLETARRTFVSENGHDETLRPNGDISAPMKQNDSPRNKTVNGHLHVSGHNGNTKKQPPTTRNNDARTDKAPLTDRESDRPVTLTQKQLSDKPVTLTQKQWKEYKNKQDQHPGMPPPVTRAQHDIYRSPKRHSKETVDTLQVSGTPCLSPRDK